MLHAAPDVLLPGAMLLRSSRFRAWTLPDGEGLILMWVEPGSIALGRDDGEVDERPSHAQEVPSGFWISRTPVGRGTWRAFLEATGRPPLRRSWLPWLDDRPIGDVAWQDAAAFCAWAGLSLPTEVEWEKAASLREAEAAGPLALRCSPSGAAVPCPACLSLLGPRPGLVWAEGLREWCADWYSPRAYLSYAVGITAPPASGAYRLARSPRGGRPRSRWGLEPTASTRGVGLRPILRPTRPGDGAGP